jgi:hypothetical protein
MGAVIPIHGNGYRKRSMVISRRRMLFLATAAPLLGRLPFTHAATRQDLRFRALWQGAPVGEHRVAFRSDGERLTVDTHIDITVKVLFFTVFRLKHEAQEVWRSGRLISLAGATERDGAQMKVSGSAVKDGFLIIGEDGPFLAAAQLLTSNSLWDSRIVRQSRLIDVQYGGEVGLVARRLGDEQVGTPQGPVPATRYQMITPYYAGSVFYDAGERWVKALVETKGETLEYVLAT